MNWRASLFDRLAPNDLGLEEADREKLGRQGLLHLGLGLLSNGGGFGNALGAGLQSGLLAMNQGAEDVGQRQYRRDLSARMKANTDAEATKRLLAGQMLNPDGTLNPEKYNQYASLDPQGAKAFRDATQPDQSKYALGEIGTPGGGKLPVFFNPTRPGEVFDVAGQPMFGGQPQTRVAGGGSRVLNDAFFQAQEQAESGGNPNAVSPKGAFGPMQIMPATAADPGFGMASLPASATEGQNREFGREYMTRITQEMGGDPVAGLMAYNWGIGNAQRALQSAGGDVQAALAMAPRETRDYVTKIMGSQQGGNDPLAGRPGYVAPKPEKSPFQSRQYTPEEVAKMGLAAGTVAYTTEGGKPDIVYKPPAKGAGGSQVIDNGDGTQTIIPAGKTTEDQNKSAGYALRMEKALRDIAESEKSDPDSNRPGIGVAILNTLPDAISNYGRSQERQNVEAAQLDALDAALTLNTGAAYTKEQLKGLSKAYFPQPGDEAKTVEQKRQRLESLIQTARLRARGAYPTSQPAASAPKASGAPRKLRFNPKTGKIE